MFATFRNRLRENRTAVPCADTPVVVPKVYQVELRCRSYIGIGEKEVGVWAICG